MHIAAPPTIWHCVIPLSTLMNILKTHFKWKHNILLKENTLAPPAANVLPIHSLSQNGLISLS